MTETPRFRRVRGQRVSLPRAGAARLRYPRPVTDKPVPRKVALRPAEGLRRKVDYTGELNPEQLAVVMHAGGPMLVLAGAGSGKTRTVVYRVARLLEDGADPNAVLLLTFTNRAAREMLSRVGLLLGRDAGRVMGGTFHSVGNRLLRRCGERLGYPSNYGTRAREDAVVGWVSQPCAEPPEQPVPDRVE